MNLTDGGAILTLFTFFTCQQQNLFFPLFFESRQIYPYKPRPFAHEKISTILNFVQINFLTSSPQDFDKFAQNFVGIIFRPSRINLLFG